MTDPNKYNPYPYIATIRCPTCDGPAEFRKAFALISKRHWDWWKARLWPCARITHWDGVEHWTPQDAPVDATWRSWVIIEQDPRLFAWKKPARAFSADDNGIVACPACIARRAHTLSWPTEAFYRFELRQGVLWAWSRSTAEAALAFIESKERDATAHGHFLFLRHIPKVFLKAKDRDAIAKRMRRSLSA